jgi:chromosome segregation ATPase
MKKLTKIQIDTKNQLARRLDQSEQDVREAIHVLNQRLVEAWAEVTSTVGHHNELREEVNDFLRQIHDEQVNYQEDRPDSWQGSERGHAYGNWADEWEVLLDEITVECPEPVEEPDMDAAEVLRELPDQP